MSKIITANELSDSEYRKKDFMSKSALDDFNVSPLNYWYKHLNPNAPVFPDTPALRIGRAAHVAILEPARFNDEVVVLSDDINRRTKAGKEEIKEFERKNKDKLILTSQDMDLVEKLMNAIDSNPLTKEWIDRIEQAESSIFYEVEGVKFKSRIDGIGDGFIVDLKTTQEAAPYAFNMSVKKYRYHVQAYLYSIGFYEVYQKWPKDFIFVVVQKSAPYEVAAFRLSDDWYDLAKDEVRNNLDEYKACLKSNHWYGVDRGRILELTPPAYLIKTNKGGRNASY